MTTLHSCADLGAIDPSCEAPDPPHPKRALVNSLSLYKRPVWDDLSFVTWCIIQLQAATRRWLHCGYKGTDMFSNNTQTVAFKWCLVVTKGSKVCQENIPSPLHHRQTEQLDPCFHVVFLFWPYAHQTRQRFSNPVCFVLGKLHFPVLSCQVPCSEMLFCIPWF